MDDKKSQKKGPRGGVEAAAELVAGLDPEAQARLLADLARRDPQLAVRIEKLVLRFEDLSALDSREMQALIAAVPVERLALALREHSAEQRAPFEAGMSERGAKILREEIEASKSKPASDVHSARLEILEKARELGKQGKLTLKQGLKA